MTNRCGLRPLLYASILSPLLLLSACHSRHVDITLENHTGAAIQLLEVDYPSASFGADSLAAGADFHYRIQIEGNGPIKISYTPADGKPVQITGLQLDNLQQGRLEIDLLPGAKADFHPQLSQGKPLSKLWVKD